MTRLSGAEQQKAHKPAKAMPALDGGEAGPGAWRGEVIIHGLLFDWTNSLCSESRSLQFYARPKGESKLTMRTSAAGSEAVRAGVQLLVRSG
jgi:hypothetical protein